MSIATIDIQPRVQKIDFLNDNLSVTIEDGRVILVPQAWYPRLQHATETERNHWRVFEDSNGRDVIFWEELDELIPVIALLTGVSSRESKRSFDRWLAARSATI
jgi:hypothetical protein